MEGILVMLLYLAIGFFKNRSDKMKRKEIESDPDWNNQKKSNQSFNFDNLLTKIIDDTNFDDKEIIDKNSYVIDEGENSKNFNESQIKKEENEFKSHSPNKSISKEKKIGLKIKQKAKKEPVKRNYLFKNPNSLKKAIIFREIIDKPLSLR